MRAFALMGCNDPSRVRQLAEHLRRVHRLHARGGKIEHARIVEAHGVFGDEASFRHVAEIRAVRDERALLERGPYGALPPLALRGKRRVAAQAAAESRAPCRQRIVDHDPGHIGLRFHFERDARDVAAPPLGRCLPLDRRYRARDAIAARQRLLERDRRDALQRDPRRAGAVLCNADAFPRVGPRQALRERLVAVVGLPGVREHGVRRAPLRSRPSPVSPRSAPRTCRARPRPTRWRPSCSSARAACGRARRARGAACRPSTPERRSARRAACWRWSRRRS